VFIILYIIAGSKHPHTENNWKYEREILYSPLSSLSNPNPVVKFYMPPSSEFTDLSKTQLILKVKVERTDGKPVKYISSQNAELFMPHDTDIVSNKPKKDKPEEDDEFGISVPNDFFDCLIQRMQVEVNGVVVGAWHSHHSQVEVLRKLLLPSDEASNNFTHSIMWQVIVSFLIVFFILCSTLL